MVIRGRSDMQCSSFCYLVSTMQQKCTVHGRGMVEQQYDCLPCYQNSPDPLRSLELLQFV
jgi:hypothetical protein